MCATWSCASSNSEGVFFALTRRDEAIGFCNQIDTYPNLIKGCHVPSRTLKHVFSSKHVVMLHLCCFYLLVRLKKFGSKVVVHIRVAYKLYIHLSKAILS